MSKVLVHDPGPLHLRRASLRKKKLKVQAVGLLEQRGGPLGLKRCFPGRKWAGRTALATLWCLPPEVLTSASRALPFPDPHGTLHLGSLAWAVLYPLQPGEAAAWARLGTRGVALPQPWLLSVLIGEAFNLSSEVRCMV